MLKVLLYMFNRSHNFEIQTFQVLKLMIWNCLTEADKLKCSSIAFPSLGTGNLFYPFHLVAETMFHTIQCYEQCHSDTKIKNISIVLYEKDVECIQVRNIFITFKPIEKNFFSRDLNWVICFNLAFYECNSNPKINRIGRLQQN